jgi:hypothetical protein
MLSLKSLQALVATERVANTSGNQIVEDAGQFDAEL